jgi:hypothetical protein
MSEREHAADTSTMAVICDRHVGEADGLARAPRPSAPLAVDQIKKNSPKINRLRRGPKRLIDTRSFY